MEAAPHIISRQKIRLSYTGSPDALALRQLLSRVCNAELPARLDDLLSRYDPGDRVLYIDRLDVRISLRDDGRLDETLGKAIIEQVEIALRLQLQSASTAGESPVRSMGRALMHYLEHGYLPWWSLAKSEAEFIQFLNEGLAGNSAPELIHGLMPLMRAAGPRSRLAAMLRPEALDVIVQLSGLRKADDWANWKEVVQLLRERLMMHASFDRALAEALLEASCMAQSAAIFDRQLAAMLMPVLQHYAVMHHARLPASLREVFIAASREADLAAASHTPHLTPLQKGHAPPESQKPENPRPPEPGTAIRIGNAGLVLLAPFLPQFFKHTGVEDEAGRLDRPRAISLLRYLVYSDEQYTEFEIVLEKILCGIPLPDGIPSSHRLTQEERQEAETLLTSVVGHWSVLKNTSTEGLRQSFLQRDGRLVSWQQQWELSIQKQAHDILLDYLPWNVSQIRLPYMSRMMTVKWNI